MKSLLRWLAPVVLLTISCSEETPFNPDRMNPAAENPAGELNNTMEAPGQSRSCASYEVLQAQMKADPKLKERMDAIERFTEEYVKKNAGSKLLADGTIEIPVQVNVLYRTAAENISEEQIDSQIAVLNADFSATNSDITKIPTDFIGLKKSMKIKFVRTGLPTIRKPTKKTSWQTNNDMKRSSRGGIDPNDPTLNLNIWVCVLANNILGYAQFPGGNSSTDGVVIHTKAFGAGSKFSLFTSYNLGRTATHEVGHYLNLRHIWGDATCGDDFVTDTPFHNASNGGCPVYPHYSTCTGKPVEMTMNYMDYTNDACMYMFSAGQVSRMDAVFAAGGPRNPMAQP